MSQSDNQYTKLRWLLTIVGLFMYVVDIWTDIGLALKYFQDKHFVWTGLTLAFVLAGLLVTQIFSYAWYRDDMNDALINPEGRPTLSGISKGGLAVLHLFGVGIFTRYCQLLKQGFKVVWTTANAHTGDVHHKLFCMATDLSMLKLFEAFLESVPQLLLQLYIVLGHAECSVLQYLSMTFSFFNIAWALVDYRRCLRRSLRHFKEMPSGLPTVIYLLYKLCTITSHILSYALLLILSTYTTIALTVLWLLGTTWTHFLQTNFCLSRGLELLYRAVIGVILTFTFFNVKGQDTKIEMIIYYFFYSLMHIMAPLLLGFFKPELQSATFLLTVSGLIFGGTVLGLVCLVLYYLLLHPRGTQREADEVDGLGNETETTLRISNFLQP
ncbi:XK-related protein 9 [Dicentrarchus labrax]|uniref:XK-related protein n=1 Tax=Dicentrarchus labrax TaxID=13489 RepID=E6ZIN3_DICLA|nr:XK-related protein 9 [Dicentrarchus labrax]XP_051266305.1 XK-related protein 9 [Dicentrarchus labrax]CBN81917.1 XK-related protein 9 [Dicentrarchus labrax]